MSLDPTSGSSANDFPQPHEKKDKDVVIAYSSTTNHERGSDTPSLIPENEIASMKQSDTKGASDLELWYKQTIANMRKYGVANIDADDIEDIQDFFSLNYSSFLGSLALAAQEKVGPPPTEFAIVGLGSLGRYEAGPYSDLDFAFLVADDSDDSRQYFLEMATEMNRLVASLDESEEGIIFCDGGLTPPFFMGKSNFPFGSQALVDTPDSMSKWTISDETPETFDKRKNMANPGTIRNSMTFSQYMYGDEKLYDRLRLTKQEQMQKIPHGSTLERYKKWHGGLTYGKLNGLELIEPKIIVEASSAELNLKKFTLSPIMNIVRGLCFYYDIDETNISSGIDELQKRGHLSPELAVRMKNVYQAAFKKRMQLQMKKHDSNFECEEVTQKEKQENAALVQELQKRATAFIRSKGKSNPFAK